MKIFIIIIILVSSIKVLVSQNLGWEYDDLLKIKGYNYVKEEMKDSEFSLNFKKDIAQYISWSDGYVFNGKTRKVVRYIGSGHMLKSDLEEIIEKNNSKYQKVKLESVDNFQWEDTEHGALYLIFIFRSYPFCPADYVFLFYDASYRL